MRPDPSFEDYQRLFSDNYDAMNYERSLSSHFMLAGHRVLENRFSASDCFRKVLEVGAGTGAHVSFIRHRFDEYWLTDCHTSMLERAVQRLPLELIPRVKICEEDATGLSFESGTFDRVIASHVLEHLPRPHEVLREWSRLLRPGGVLSLLLPCDPGILWRVGRLLGPRKRAERVGFPYDYWMAREHINSIGNLVTFIRYYFHDVEEHWYPTRVPIYDLNLFYLAHIRV